jgi:hypothetical protein
MEKRLNKVIETYITNFKNDIKNKVVDLDVEKTKLNDILEYIFDYNRLTFSKEDFVKRKRVKNSIPQLNRCNAKRANGEQCTRRRKVNCEFCGTHYKGVPYGSIQLLDTNEEQPNNKVEVIAEDINGIIYYVDKYNNVYKTEDILSGKENPEIIAKCIKDGNVYKIPEFGLM